MSDFPQTSLDAYKAVSPESLRDIYVRITQALKTLTLANYDELARFLNLPDINMVSRRLKELEELGLIYKPGTKSLTSRRRQAYQYAIKSADTVVPSLEKIVKGQKSAGDYASEIIAKTATGIKTQAKLFKEDQ